MTHLRRWDMWLNGLTMDCIKSCFVRTSVLKFELWTEWCSWQSSMVNHQEGNKGSKDTALMQSCYSNDSFTFTTDLVLQPNWPIGRAAASLLSLLLFQRTKTLVHYFSLKPSATTSKTTGEVANGGYLTAIQCSAGNLNIEYFPSLTKKINI